MYLDCSKTGLPHWLVSKDHSSATTDTPTDSTAWPSRLDWYVSKYIQYPSKNPDFSIKKGFYRESFFQSLSVLRGSKEMALLWIQWEHCVSKSGACLRTSQIRNMYRHGWWWLPSSPRITSASHHCRPRWLRQHEIVPRMCIWMLKSPFWQPQRKQGVEESHRLQG